MLTVAKVSCIAVLFLMGAGVCGRTSAYAQDAAWHVDKSSGDFWINAQVVLGNGNPTVGPGDNIRTGQNGGVVLVRGKESILISPNTEVAISKNGDDEMSTTINQRTGSITLEVEPSDMKHFEVETPYLRPSQKARISGLSWKTTTQVCMLSGERLKSQISGPASVYSSRQGKLRRLQSTPWPVFR